MIGSEIAGYRILEKLGEGGMGVVYKGIDIALDRPVAVKVLSTALANNPELVERFRAEARAQANLNHTNLATLYTFVIQNGSACMVMEFVDGETLENMIMRRGPIPALEAIPLFKQAMLGIGYAHRAGIVHRDIKPSNLMVNRMGIVKVMDFGIAKVMGTRGMTKTGAQMGTGWYMSPEQVLNKAVDIRSDIYSLGVTLYQLLTAHVPFEGTSEFEIMSGHLQAPVPLPTRFYPYIPKGIENAVLKALEKNPDNRFQTVEEFGAALEHPDDFAFAFASATVAADRPVQAAAPILPQTATTVPMDRTATMIAMPAGGIPPAPTPAPQAPPTVQKPASPLFATRQSKLLAGGAGLAAVLLVGWFTLRGPGPAPTPSLPSKPAPQVSTPTPIEQQLSTGTPAAQQMSTSTLPAPKVDSFRADSNSVPAGRKVHLSWSVSGASEVTIAPGIGAVKSQGGADVPLAKTTEFVLTAKNEKGEAASSSTTVTVAQVKADTAPPPQAPVRAPADTPAQQAPAPPSQAQLPAPPQRVVPAIVFEAMPNTIPAGGVTMLRWNLINAQSAIIEPAVGVLRQVNGQVQIRPSETTIYRLTARSKDGSSATSVVTVQVQPATQAVQPMQPVQPPIRTVQPPVRQGVVIGVMVHDHGATFGQNNVWNRCWGQMQVVGDHLQYRVIGTTDSRRDDFDVPANQVQEAAANKLPIRNQPAFHVTIGGQHYNFIPQGTSVVQAIATIRQGLQGR